jgi:hypothetical protein
MSKPFFVRQAWVHRQRLLIQAAGEIEHFNKRRRGFMAQEFKTLPGLLAGLTQELDAEAMGLAERARAAQARALTAISRSRAAVASRENTIGEIEAFADAMEGMTGHNGAPPDPLPTSPAPSPDSPVVAEPRAQNFSDLHPSNRRQNF